MTEAWGEQPPARARGPWLEGLAGLCLLGLALYALSDPIGRRAALSYEAAAQYFIDARLASEVAEVSRDNVDLTKLPELDKEPLAVRETPYAKPESFVIYARESAPNLIHDSSSVTAPRTPEQRLADGIERQLMPLTPDVDFPELDPSMKPLFDAQKRTFFESRGCSEVDRLSRLCGELQLDVLSDE